MKHLESAYPVGCVVGGGVLGSSFGMYQGVFHGPQSSRYRNRSAAEKIIDGTAGGLCWGVFGSAIGFLAPVWVPMGVIATVAVGGETAYSYITQTGVADEVGKQSKW